MKKFEFEGKDYFIKPVSANIATEAQRVYMKTFKKAIEDGAILKQSLEDHMRKQGLWDDDRQAEYETLVKKSAEIEYSVKSGSYKKASELKEKALELKKIRSQISSLLLTRNSKDSVTADGLADNERFFYLVSASVYDDLTQKPVYSSMDDYKEKADSPLALKAASEYANFAYELDENFESSLIENRLLKKLNLINDKGQLINKDGKRVDLDGNLLDDNGARVDSEGQRIDINNNPVIDDSIIDELAFEDDLT